MIEIISQRKLEEARFLAKITEWQAKSISSMLVGLAESDKQAKAMSKMVEKMELPLSDEADVIDEKTFAEIVEQGADIDLESQPSFEALSGALGQNF